MFIEAESLVNVPTVTLDVVSVVATEPVILPVAPTVPSVGPTASVTLVTTVLEAIVPATFERTAV